MSNERGVGGNRPLAALLSGPVRVVYETVIAPMRRDARRRAGARELARLDDRLLRDIGLTRTYLHAAAYGPLGPDGHSPARAMRSHPSGAGNVVRLNRRATASRVDEAAPAPPARRAAQR